MTSVSISLPFPHRLLSPNARAHWAAVAREKKALRRVAHIICLEAKLKSISTDSLTARFTFHPPSKRRIDADNLLARCKAAIDGIADATGVDDSKWQFEIAPMGEKVSGGCVEVEISWVEREEKAA